MNATKVCQAAEARLSELFEGYVLVGFVAGSNAPCIVRDNGDAKTKIALDVLLTSALNESNPAETDGQ